MKETPQAEWNHIPKASRLTFSLLAKRKCTGRRAKIKIKIRNGGRERLRRYRGIGRVGSVEYTGRTSERVWHELYETTDGRWIDGFHLKWNISLPERKGLDTSESGSIKSCRSVDTNNRRGERQNQIHKRKDFITVSKQTISNLLTLLQTCHNGQRTCKARPYESLSTTVISLQFTNGKYSSILQYLFTLVVTAVYCSKYTSILQFYLTVYCSKYSSIILCLLYCLL